MLPVIHPKVQFVSRKAQLMKSLFTHTPQAIHCAYLQTHYTIISKKIQFFFN